MLNVSYAIGAGLKLSRSESHIAEIDKAIANYIRREPFSWERKVSSEPNCTDIILRLNEAIPTEIATVVGDALHNMRSSLDNLASALAVRNGASATQQRQVYYPVGQNQADFVNKCNQLAPIIGMAASNALAATEVFVGGKGEKIKSLGEMSNTDKHRLLIPTVPKIEGTLQFGFGGDEPIPAGFEGRFKFMVGELGFGKIPACDGDLLLSYGDVNDDRFFINYQPTLTVSLDFQGLVPGESIVTTLTEMRISVVDAINQIVGLVGS
jgi:hypothetical protein